MHAYICQQDTVGMKQIFYLIAVLIFVQLSYTLHQKGTLDLKKFVIASIYAIAAVTMIQWFATYFAGRS